MTSEITRCGWRGMAGDPLYEAYHDTEWGVPEYDSRALWEKLVLDGFQAGLAWITILRKRDAFRAAFDNFDPEKVAAYGEADRARLMADAGIVRSNAKIDAAISSAKIYLAMRDAGEDFSEFCWSFTGGKPIRTASPRSARCRPDSARRRGRRRPEGQGLQVRRPGDRLRLDAGRRHGQRPHDLLLPARFHPRHGRLKVARGPSMLLERAFIDGPVCGVDEAGRGPWAGPVSAAAVILDPRRAPKGLDDSKKLSAKTREALEVEIKAKAVPGAWPSPASRRSPASTSCTPRAWPCAAPSRALGDAGLCAGGRQLSLQAAVRGEDGGGRRRQVQVDRRGLDPGQGGPRPADGRDGRALPRLRLRQPQGLPRLDPRRSVAGARSLRDPPQGLEAGAARADGRGPAAGRSPFDD
jgi:DNA-3-methyladenine glycosylase I